MLRSILWLGLCSLVALVGSHATPAAGQETVTVAVGGSTAVENWFCDPSFQNGVCETKIDAGDTVTWDFSGTASFHTTTECGADCDFPTATPLWNSGVVAPGGPPFSFTFNTPGTYLYYCQVHPFAMRGRIVVNESTQPPTPSPTPPSPPVGGFSTDLNADTPRSPSQVTDSSGRDDAMMGALAAAATAGLVALGWSVRQRRR